MGDNTKDKAKIKYLSSKKMLLEDFCIRCNNNILKRLEELYPNDVAIENYIRKIILENLED